MRVLVFDVDGTLTRTSEVDGRWYHRALEQVLPDADIDGGRAYPEFTDTAILRTVCEEVGVSDFEAVRARMEPLFMDLLTDAVSSEPESFRAIAGAPRVFDAMREAGWTPAIATGGWRRSATLKLRVAGLPIDDVPLVTSSEAEARVDIVSLAAAEAAAGAVPESVVYVGDGPWDVRACRALGIGFVGRSAAEGFGRLRAEGARAFVPDFTDPADLVGCLRDASSLIPA